VTSPSPLLLASSLLLPLPLSLSLSLSLSHSLSLFLARSIVSPPAILEFFILPPSVFSLCNVCDASRCIGIFTLCVAGGAPFHGRQSAEGSRKVRSLGAAASSRRCSARMVRISETRGSVLVSEARAFPATREFTQAPGRADSRNQAAARLVPRPKNSCEVFGCAPNPQLPSPHLERHPMPSYRPFIK